MSSFEPRAEVATIIVRGEMHQAMFTSDADFEAWMEREGSERSGWTHAGGTPYSSCIVYYPGGLVARRSTAHRVSHLRD